MKYLIYAVEDDESIRELYKYTFKNVDYDIETFENAESMLDTLDTRIPNVILMDVMLPGIDGITAVERIRANESYDEVSIIVISAKGDELNKVKGLDAGADDYLAKPFGVLELVARVKANIRKRYILRRSYRQRRRTYGKREGEESCAHAQGVQSAEIARRERREGRNERDDTCGRMGLRVLRRDENARYAHKIFKGKDSRA